VWTAIEDGILYAQSPVTGSQPLEGPARLMPFRLRGMASAVRDARVLGDALYESIWPGSAGASVVDRAVA